MSRQAGDDGNLRSMLRRLRNAAVAKHSRSPALVPTVLIVAAFAALSTLGYGSLSNASAEYGYGYGYGYGYEYGATTLTLTPKTATNAAGQQHCVTATVQDAFGDPVAGVTVRFSVSGSDSTSGSGTTDANGQATFCYTVSAFPGADAIHAFADTNSNSAQDAGEPFDDATKVITLPASTPGCKVTGGGRITAANGDKATFGGSARFEDAAGGEEEYQDHGPAEQINVHSIDVSAVVCSPDETQATIFGQATIDGSGSHIYRIDVKDLAEPGANDTYRIRLSTGYDSGEQTLTGGNVQIH